MMKANQWLACVGCLTASVALFNSSLGPVLDDPDAPSSSLITLYAHDDLLSAYSFRSAGPGGVLRGGEIDLSGAQIAFNMFATDQLSFGFVGNQPVSVVDLGDIFVPGFARARDLAPKFAPSVFHTLVLDGTKVSYRGSGGRLLRLKKGQRIFDPLLSEGLYHFKPVIGHTYLMRLEPRGKEEELYKFEVVDFLPGHSVTMRWGSIPHH